MRFTYKPRGVCSHSILIETEASIITALSFKGGCNGNLQGISTLAIGQRPQDLIDKLAGITCGLKHTSCPDQLSRALTEMLAVQEKNASSGVVKGQLPRPLPLQHSSS